MFHHSLGLLLRIQVGKDGKRREEGRLSHSHLTLETDLHNRGEGVQLTIQYASKDARSALFNQRPKGQPLTPQAYETLPVVDHSNMLSRHECS